MKLDAYLKKRNISVSDAAEVLGYSRQRLYQIMSGTSQPGRVLALRIVAWSKGKVTLKDLIANEEQR
jgi:transcriptional regulator with XRE-family HTH domain